MMRFKSKTTAALLAVFCGMIAAGWIDPDTSSLAEKVVSYIDNREHTLVFSDEFNTDGRQFHDGKDPRWTAIHKDDYTNYALQYYNSDLISTANGVLNITTIVRDVTFEYEDVVNRRKIKSKKTKNYQSGMLQGWNKFCFTGGIIEIAARLPGEAYIGGLWPAMWMMGNLARATYVGSSNNMWPWSFDTCRHGKAQHQQLLSACNRIAHFGMHPYQGRGAPEMDILEAMPGKEVLPHTSTQKPYFSTSLQVAPAIEGYRPQPTETPVSSLWYHDEYLTYGRNTSLNIFFYGMQLEGVTPDRSYTADAVSANRNLEETHFQEMHTYRLEWEKGEEGYLAWFLDGELIYKIEAGALNMSGAIIPEEPMYLILNTAISSTWGFPTPCPEGCPCDCFDCRNPDCACAIPHDMCRNLPAHFLVDYVRVYQIERDANHTVGCSTHTHPTSAYIQANAALFKSKRDAAPLKPVPHGGGSSRSDADCGGNYGRGVCTSKGRCQCASDLFTGPTCLAYQAFDDIIWDTTPILPVFPFHVPRSLLVLAPIALVALLIVGGWKYVHTRAQRSMGGHAYEEIR